MGAPQQTLEQYRDLPPLKATSLPWPQRAASVRAELNVEVSPRYKPTDTATWCNVYLTDFIAGMGLIAPRHWVMSDGQPATVGKGIELSANKLIDWFDKHGPRYGWMSADAATAQNAAERGHVVVVGWKNPKAKPGHVAIVVGRDRITQAGRTNLLLGSIKEGFGDVKPLKWYVQMERPGGHNV